MFDTPVTDIRKNYLCETLKNDKNRLTDKILQKNLKKCKKN
jgi:hypothetical protein